MPAVAARNMELVATLPKPPGFFDPKRRPAPPTEPETPPATTDPASRHARSPRRSRREPAATDARSRRQRRRRRRAALNFANSDLAFRGSQLFIGNFNGFNIYDISNPKKPRLLASVVCPGGQGDVSVHGNLLFMSVEQTRGRIDCGTQGVEAPVSAERFRGVRIFDITDIKKPKQIAAVQTCRGSHTHTLVVGSRRQGEHLHLRVRHRHAALGEELAGCSDKKPEEDPNTALFSIDVIQVPLAAPEKARDRQPAAHLRRSERPAPSPGSPRRRATVPGTQTTRVTNQCHDITVFPEVGLAAGACSGNGILLDISDPVNPVRLDPVADKNFAYWHSATFNNDGTKVIFTDEWGGGTQAALPRRPTRRTWGADAIFDIVDRKLQFRSYYKLPAPQTERRELRRAQRLARSRCRGATSWSRRGTRAGVSVFDFTDSAKPVEIAYFDRGPVDARRS